MRIEDYARAEERHDRTMTALEKVFNWWMAAVVALCALMAVCG